MLVQLDKLVQLIESPGASFTCFTGTKVQMLTQC
jgi:hypothetical protein